MGFKSLSIVLFGLAFVIVAQNNSCLLKFSSGSLSEYRQGEGVYTQPFGSLKSLQAVEAVSPYCDVCSLTVFKGKAFNGTSKVIDFRTRIGNNSQISWSFDAQSYTLECFPQGETPKVETMRRLQEWEPEEQETGEWEEEEQEEEFDEEHNPYPQSQIYEAVFRKMNPGDGSILPTDLIAKREQALEYAFEDFIYPRGLVPRGQYTIVKTFATEICTNFKNTYRFNVQVRDELGVEYRLWYIIVVFYREGLNDLEGGVKENRLAEFPVLSWAGITETGLDPQVAFLRTKAVNQAIGKMTAKKILPQGNYSISKTSGAEYSLITNMPEYADENDMLYRFNVTLKDASGFVSKIWVVIATNYEDAENYELIDFGYIESSLAEFTGTKWITSYPEDLKEKAINEAVKKMKAKNALPAEWEYQIIDDIDTQFSSKFEHPDYSTDEYILFNFSMRVQNQNGNSYEIYAIVIVSYDDLSHFELLDYGKVKRA